MVSVHRVSTRCSNITAYDSWAYLRTPCIILLDPLFCIFFYRTSYYQCSWAAHFFAFSPWLWWCRGTWTHLNKTIRYFILALLFPPNSAVQKNEWFRVHRATMHCFCHACTHVSQGQEQQLGMVWCPPLVLLLVTGAGEHGPDGKPCAICTLRALRWIQRWSVADLAVPLLPTSLFFCVVPGSADFVAQLLGLLIYHQRRRQIPFSRSKDQPLSALKAVAFYNLQFRCFFHAFSDHPDGAPLMLATCKCGYSLEYKRCSNLFCWPLLQEGLAP